MRNKLLILILILLMFPVMCYCEQDIEFTVTTYNNNDYDYDITYYYNYEEIAKQHFENNKIVTMTGKLPNGKLNLVNYNNISVATINVKNNKFNGLCTFLQRRYSIRFAPPYDKVQSMYKDGLLNGTTKIFNMNDQLIFELNYKEGFLDGESIYFDYNLMKKKIVKFYHGERQSEKTVNLK